MYFSQFQSLGSPRSRHWHIPCLVRAPILFIDSVIFSLCPHMAEGMRELSWTPFIRTLISCMRVEHLPRAPPPLMLILRVRISTLEFGGDVNI